MDQTMTVEEVVRNTIGILNGIQVPAGLSSAIGVPVEQAIHNLNLCVDAWEREAREAQVRAMEEAMAAQQAREAEKPEDGREELPEPGMEPIILRPRDVGCPEEEADHAD